MTAQTTDGYGPDGIDGSAVGRTQALTALVLGIGGLLLASFGFGAVLCAIGIVLGVIAIVKARKAKTRVQMDGRQPRTGGTQGLAAVGIVTGVLGCLLGAVVFQSATAINNCINEFEEQDAQIACIDENAILGGGLGSN